jgi:hypothetical protein
MKRGIALGVLLLMAGAAHTTPHTKKIRCDRAKQELRLVNQKLSGTHPAYAGDLKREKVLWEKQVRENCHRADWSRL